MGVGVPKATQAAAAPAEESRLSEAIERYLEAIFYIDAEGMPVRGAHLAEWLNVAQPTAAAALQRMVKAGLVHFSATKDVLLTPRGRELAGRIVRRHRIAERWLTDVLKFDWLSADLEASRLEHALSDAVADRIYELIGRPTTCPHGNPIPGAGGARRPERALASLVPGDRSRLVRISEVAEHEVPDLLHFLGENGFSLGGEMEVTGVSRGAGTITVTVAGRAVAMSLDVAQKIWVDAEVARS
jgi:DtxR family Mn-dependent transcriptional regulator